jgi:uncharacterized protein with FMN-binding domain
MRKLKSIPTIIGAAALTSPVTAAVAAVNQSLASAAAKKVTVVKKTVNGPRAQDDRWGYIRVTLIVRKTTTVIGTKKKVTRKIIGVKVPESPNHTDRSIYINSHALPYLTQEVLQAQMNPNIQFVSGATDTSNAFEQSLQAAILVAKKV